MISPTEKIQHQKDIESFLPVQSAMGAAIRAPIRVPMDS